MSTTYAAVSNDLVVGALATPPQILQSVQMQHQVSGVWTTIRRVDYTYYLGRLPDGLGGWVNDPNGRLGDLQLASTSDPLTQLSVTGISLSGATATATTSSGHGYHVGDVVVITGADQPEYDGTFFITAVPSGTTFSYAIDGSPASSTATGTMAVAKPIDTSYYRYNKFLVEGNNPSDGASNNLSTTGGPAFTDPAGYLDSMVTSGLRTVVQGASFSRLAAMLPAFQSASDATIQPYVNNFFTYERWADHPGVDGAINASGYDANRNYDWRNGYRTSSRYRVTQEIAQGVGCSCAASGGQGTFKFNYTANYDHSTDPITGSPYFGYNQIDTNIWRMKTTETLPDGNENVIYTDEIGLPMLSIFAQLDIANAKSVSSMSIDSLTDIVTVTSTAHGLNTGDFVAIQGSVPELYNGIFKITKIDADTFTFVLPANYLNTVYGSDPVTPGGTITATKVLAQTETFHKYDSQGRIVLTAQPSAITGYDDSKNDLLNNVSGSYTYLASNAGRIDITDFYSSTGTSVSSTTPGGIAGYIQDHKVAQGQNGIASATILDMQDYYKVANGSATIYPIADHTVYGQTSSGDPRKTSYSYTWNGTASVQMVSMTVTQPPIVAAQNGPASSTSDTANADKTTYYYDANGRVVFTKDGSGYINFTKYDDGTGAVLKTITDADTTISGDFTGGVSPTNYAGLSSLGGSHLRLTNTYAIEGLGRPTQITDPNGNNTFITYNDVNHETRTYTGWQSVGGGQSNTTGPVQITREYRPTNNGGTNNAIVYEESITATILPHSGNPTGNEDFFSGGTVGGQIQTLSRDYTNNGSQTVRSDRYFTLGSGTSAVAYSTNPYIGVAGTNFYSTIDAYDDRGRMTMVKTPTGTITHTVYDGLGRVASVWIGTNDQPASGDDWSPTNQGTNSNMTDVQDNYYDNYTGSTTAVGDGNLTRTVQHIGTFLADRPTEYFYDWRDRLVATKVGVKLSGGAEDTANETDGYHRLITYNTLDNQGEITQQDTYAGDQVGITFTSGVPNAPTSSKLRARVNFSYDDQGRLFQTQQSDVIQSGTSAGSLATTNTLSSYTFYDHRGNVMATVAPGGLAAKYTIDGAGRTIKQFSTDAGILANPSTWNNWSNAASVSSDVVVQQVDKTYDANSNATTVTTRQRFHDDATNGAGLGSLMDPNNNPKARASYQAFYYDAANRLTDSVDVGTNGTNGAYTAPGSAPTNRSDILLLTHTTYNSAGWTDTVTDPRGVAARTLYDMLGRTSESIAAYDGTINGGLPSGANNQTTDYTYDGSDHVLTMKAWVTNSGTNQVFQTTQYVYGVTTAGGSKLFSNDLLAKVQYPDKTTGNPGTNTSDIVSFKYNNAGQRIGMTDQNNTVHVYSYDPLGRIGDDTATPGSGVDSTITEMQTYYNDAGQMYLKTSFTNVQTNQVQLTFNGLGQVVTEYQEHNGMVNGGSSQKVQYAYNEMSGGANNSRLTSMTYPNGRVLNYLYGTGLDTSISRVSSQSEGAGTNAVTLAGYSYLGLNTIVKESHPQPGVDLTYIKQGSEPVGDAGDQYTGLDRFGRVVDQRYLNTNSGTNLTATDRFQYGYDRNGNTLYKNNLLNSGSSELYHANSTTSGDNNTAYDPLNRLAGFSRGTLTASANNGGGLDTIATTNRSALAGSLKTWSLDQQGNWTSSSTDGTSTSRTNNDKNQVTSLTTGTNTTNLTFDNNGNTTQDDNGDKYVYDSWNRLVTVKNAANTVIATYKYDPFGRRIQQTEGGVTTDLYYGGTGDWQNLEEQVGGTTKVQNVWSLAYIDDLVLRDRDADNNPATGNWGKTGSGLEERLFAQHDANHNTTAITDQTGSVKQRFVYDPYGKATVLTSGWASSSD